MLEPDHVTDLVHGHLEPGPAILALPPVERRVHDRSAAGDTGHGLRRQRRLLSPDVSRGHGEAVRIGLHEPDAGVAAEELEDLAGPLFLRLGDRVLQLHAVEAAVVRLEVVILDGRPDIAIRANRSQTVARAGDRNVTVARRIDRAVLRGESEAAGGRRQRRPRGD